MRTIKFAFVLFLIFAAVCTNAAGDSNILERTANLSSGALSARTALIDSKSVIDEMAAAKFNTTRAGDIFQTALQLYDGQLALEAQGKVPLYTEIIGKAEEIANLRNSAFGTLDKLNGLKLSLDERKNFMNISVPYGIYLQALDDLKTGRYESADSKIDESYKKISELESTKSYSIVIYEASKSLGQRIVESWKQISIVAAIIIVALILLYDRLYISLVKVRQQMLESELQTLHSLIEKTQDDYFNKGAMPETVYHIRLKKYGELMRDINRQLPLLREAIEKKRGILTNTLKKDTDQK